MVDGRTETFGKLAHAGSWLGAPLEQTVYRGFARAFSAKVALYLLVPAPGMPPFSGSWWIKALVLGAGLACVWSPRPWATGVLALLSAMSCLAAFPVTANHKIAETAVLFLLTLFPACHGTFSYGGRLIMLLCLSIWFYGGVQKIVYGAYLDGSMFAHRLLYTKTALLTPQLARLATWFEPQWMASLPPLPLRPPALLWQHPIDFPASLRWLFVALGSSTVLVELGAPLLFVWKRTRPVAPYVLLVVGLVVGLISVEVSFALDNLMMTLLFLPRLHRAYDGLLGVAVGLALGRLL